MKIYIIEELFDSSCYKLKDRIAFKNKRDAEAKLKKLNNNIYLISVLILK
jgi:hypothetical protein